MTTEPLARPAARPPVKPSAILIGSGGVLLALTLLCFTAPWIAWLLGVDGTRVDIFNRLAPPGADHWLGTDELGRDYLIRVLEGGRVSLAVGLIGAVAAALIGTAIGLIGAYAGGRVDALAMRLTDLVIALPILPLLLIVAAIDPARLGLPTGGLADVGRIVVIVALFGWPTVARVARSAALSVRRRTYVLAAEALGARAHHVLWRHVLPNVAGPILVAATLGIGNVVLVESVLSFLGLGVQPPTPSWGNLLSDAQTLLVQAPLLAIVPGLMIFVTVIAFNALGDGLQAHLDRRRAVR
ncbi:MAG: ABC transporter permease [Geminicoccaceae bacterium]|nr:MAG: ABC transporter permease [Geminicoccaceae bacterium]